MQLFIKPVETIIHPQTGEALVLSNCIYHVDDWLKITAILGDYIKCAIIHAYDFDNANAIASRI